YSKAAAKGVNPSDACVAKATKGFAKNLQKCAGAARITSLENQIDTFARAAVRSSTIPTTTTTTTETTTTTTTLAPPLGQHLAFTTALGSPNCGGPKQNPAPEAPFSGEIDSDTAGTTKLADLGLSCLYIGGGQGNIAASVVPENATNILDTADGVNLTASAGTGSADCSKGPLSTQHCLNDPSITCTSDAHCGGIPTAGAVDAARFC